MSAADTAAEKTETEGEDTCTVCMTPYSSKPTEGKCTTPCAHDFCGECARTWFKDHASCPLCRAPMNVHALKTTKQVTVPLFSAATPTTITPTFTKPPNAPNRQDFFKKTQFDYFYNELRRNHPDQCPQKHTDAYWDLSRAFKVRYKKEPAFRAKYDAMYNEQLTRYLNARTDWENEVKRWEHDNPWEAARRREAARRLQEGAARRREAKKAEKEAAERKKRAQEAERERQAAEWKRQRLEKEEAEAKRKRAIEDLVKSM